MQISQLTLKFLLSRQILNRTNNIFELLTRTPVQKKEGDHEALQRTNSMASEDDMMEGRLRLKGQMIYMDNWRMIMFLATPVMPKLQSLIHTGLYINDLSMHDFSR